MLNTRAVDRRIVRIPAGGVQLEAAFEVPTHPIGTLVFAHGSGSSRMSPRNRFVAIELRGAGFATLLLDLLTETEDLQGDSRFDVALLAARLQAAVRWTKAQPVVARMPTGLFGASTGAAAAVEVACAMGEVISALVLRGGRPDLARPESLAQVTAPTLLLVGELDPEALAVNEAAFARLTCPKSLVIVPHATHLFEEPGTLETVASLASQWFTKNLRVQPQAA